MTVPREEMSHRTAHFDGDEDPRAKEPKHEAFSEMGAGGGTPGLGIKIPIKIHGSALSYTARSHHNLLLSSDLSVRP